MVTALMLCIRARLCGGSPRIYAGEERFSAPGNGLDSITRFSAGETTCGKLTLYQGTTLQAVEKPNVFEGYDL